MVGKISHWIDLGSNDPHTKLNSELVCLLVLLQDVASSICLCRCCSAVLLHCCWFCVLCFFFVIQVLRQELGLASHLGLCAVCLPSPSPSNYVNLARVITQVLPSLPASMQLWVPFRFGSNIQVRETERQTRRGQEARKRRDAGRYVDDIHIRVIHSSLAFIIHCLLALGRSRNKDECETT